MHTILMNLLTVSTLLISTWPLHALATEYYSGFDTPWNEALTGSLYTTKDIRDAPSGKYGSARVKNGKLEFESGMPLRMWGVGIRITNEFPPSDHEEAQAIAKRIASYGFNHIRIYGFDYNKPGIFKYWLQNKELPKEKMDRLCQFITLAKQQGIYYSISPNHNSLRYLNNSKIPSKGRRHARMQFSSVQLLDDKLIDITKSWATDLFTYTGGKCSIPFASDPANVYFDAVNEASIFQSYNHNFKFIDKHNFKLLRFKFSNYLKNIYKDTNTLRKRWSNQNNPGLDDGENLEDHTINVHGKKTLNSYSDTRINDTINFLLNVDKNFYETIISSVRKAGFNGLVSTTNHWYGDALLANNDIADVVEMHVYFDRPRGASKSNKSGWLLDWSYVDNEFHKQPKRWNYKYNPLFLLFESSLYNKPLIISEWNHGAWSKYAYEGAVILPAYSAFQGYPILDLHTYQESISNYKSAYNVSGVSFSGNPVLLSLMPTLSLAYLRGDISIAQEEIISYEANTHRQLNKKIARNGEFLNSISNEISSDYAFHHKYSRVLVNNSQDTQKTRKKPFNIMTSDTGQLNWIKSTDDASSFIINTPNYQAIVGSLNNLINTDLNVEPQIKEHGAVTIISLDNEPVDNSKQLLLTAVSSYTRNDRIENNDFSFFRTPKKTIKRSGHSPFLLKKMNGTISLTTNKSSTPKIYAVLANGKRFPVINVQTSKYKDMYRYEFHLSNKSPWYIIEFD